MDLDGIICGDCDAQGPKWASINRGVLLCDECCSVHRQLGRYVSQIKHIRHSNWRPTQLTMFNYLAKANVNRFWEHLIHEKLLNKKQLTKKEIKPRPNDSLMTKKREFIVAKYSSLAFMQKPQKTKLNDLNQQLHASVRTGVLETSLQLLALGANPNALHPTKGTSAVHHACESDQIGQLELLIIYGGDICSRDLKNRNAFDIALKKCLNSANVILNGEENEDTRNFPSNKIESAIEKLKNSWTPLMDALVCSFYEIPDVFSHFLFKTTPNHKQGILSSSNSQQRRGQQIDNQIKLVNGHFFLPLNDFIQGHEVNSDKNHHIRSLKNQRFQYLCTDIHDETERRSLNEIFTKYSQTSQALISPDLSIPFLPINTEFSQVRNQARQKLARLTEDEFREILVDTLLEVSVRLNPIFPPLSTQRSVNSSADSQQLMKMFDSINRASNPDLLHSMRATQMNGEGGNNTESASFEDQGQPGIENGLIGDITPLNERAKMNEPKTDLEDEEEDRIYDDPVYDQVAIDGEFSSNQQKKILNSPIKPSRGVKIERASDTHPINKNEPMEEIRVDQVTSEIVRLKQANLELKERLFQMQSAKYQYETKFGDLESEINILKKELVMLKMEKNQPSMVNQSYDSGNSFKPGMNVSDSFDEVNESHQSSNTQKISDVSCLNMDNGFRPSNPTSHFYHAPGENISEYDPNPKEPVPAERKTSPKKPLENCGSSTQNDSESIPSESNILEDTTPANNDNPSQDDIPNDFIFNEKTKADILEAPCHAFSKNDQVRENPAEQKYAQIQRRDHEWQICPNGKKAEISAKSASLRDQQSGDKIIPSNQFAKYLSSEQLNSKSPYSTNPQHEESMGSINHSPTILRHHSLLRNGSNHSNYNSGSPVPRTTSPLIKPSPYSQPSQRSNYPYSNNSTITHQQTKSILKNNTQTTTLPANGVTLPVRNIKNSSDAVVQAVELIISRIRNLLDVANGRSIGNPVQLSRAIQTAVNEILILFPLSVHSKGPYSSLAPSLALLRTSSISLSQYCQRQSLIAEDKYKTPIKVEVIIKHAHEIARSAKEILSQYQNKSPD